MIDEESQIQVVEAQREVVNLLKYLEDQFEEKQTEYLCGQFATVADF